MDTMVQLLSLYTDPECHKAQRYRRTDGRHYDANSRSYCVTVRSAKNNNNTNNKNKNISCHCSTSTSDSTISISTTGSSGNWCCGGWSRCGRH